MERTWLKSYPPGLQQHLTYPDVPAYSFLFEQVAKHPERTALLFYGKAISYGQLGSYIDRFAAALVRRFGVARGDRVGIILPNCPQNVIAIHGIQRAGAIPVPFNPMYVPREIAYQIADAGCNLMITLDLFWPKVKEAGGAQRYIVTSMADFLPFPLNLLFPLKTKAPRIGPEEAFRLKALLREPIAGFQPVPVNPKEEPAVLLYTGGTTGVSKGVILTHANITANLLQIAEWMKQPGQEHTPKKVMVILPTFHSYGFTVALGNGLASGDACILVPKFEAGEMLKLLAKYQPDAFPGIPTIYTALLKHPDFAKHRFQIGACISGAAPMPVELLRRFEEATGCTIAEGYGLTETSPVTHCNPRFGRRVPGSVGLALPDTDVRIVDLESREDLPPGQVGEVLLRGPQVMKGYWNKPEETSLILRDGWLYTGDVGRLDEDGYLYIVDRVKDMIIAGGFNIYPREIDEVLYQHPAVQEACTVGIRDEYRGETVKSYVVLKSGMMATEQEILDFCRERLAAYKRPRAVVFRESLPKTIIGKVLRRALVQEEMEKRSADTVSVGQ